MKLNSLQTFLVTAAAVSFTAYGALTVLPPSEGRMPNLVGEENPVALDASASVAAPTDIKITKADGATATVPKTMAELTAREYVLTFTSDRTGYGRDGQAVHFTQVAETDSVQISWFFYEKAFKGKVDFEKGEIIVPAQYVKTTDEDDVWFMPYDGKTWTLTGEVILKYNEDGSITPDKGWGFMLKNKPTSGYTWNKTAANTQFLVPNGTMECEKVETEDNVTKNVKYTYPVVGSQTGNVLTILNFADNGNYANFILGSDGSISVPQQLEVVTYYVNYYMAGNVKVDENNRISWNWSYDAVSSTANSFKLGPWSLIGYHKTTGGMYWYGLYNYAEIKLDFDINYKSAYLDGTGKANDPYLIKNAADLTKFIEFSNKHSNLQGLIYKQAADIDLGGMELAIPLITSEFNNIYDGGNFTLKGLNLVSGTTDYAGIFNILGVDGVIQNLTLEGKAKFTQKYSAPLVGKNYGVLNNVTNKMEITQGAQYCGGLTAYCYNGSEMNNCVFAGTINMTDHYVGGLSAYSASATFTKCGFTGKFVNADEKTKAINNVGGLVAYSYPSTYIECYSDGVFSKDSLSTYRGGLTGYAYAGTTATGNYGQFLFKKCVNKTDIKGKQYLGGIAATLPIPAATSATNYKYRSNILIDSCVNYGNLYSTVSGYAGGITGNMNNPAVVSNCENHGSVKAFKGSYFGGIIGYITSTGANDSIRSKVINCRNYAEIGDIDLSDANTAYGAGGIIGDDATPYGTLESCENYGDISSVYNGGGIVGMLVGNYNSIKACANYGDVTNKAYNAGGIVGSTGTATQSVTDNINFGTVEILGMIPGVSNSATSGTGPAAGGIVGHGNGLIADNLNVAKVTGPSLVGGVVGRSVKGTSEANFGCKIVRNLNAGKVRCRYTLDDKTVEATDSLGAILGVSLTNATLWNPEYNSQDSNYYTSNVLADLKLADDYASVHVGTVVSEADLINFNKLGSAWSCYDKYCYPTPVKTQNSDLAKVWAAQVVAGGNDKLPNITQDFYVGAPKGLVWTSTSPELTFNGTNATWGKPAVVGEVTLTAKCGDFEKTIVLKVDKATSVEELATETSEVASEHWLNTAGQRVAKPTFKDGQVYIVIRSYSSGKTETLKVMN